MYNMKIIFFYGIASPMTSLSGPLLVPFVSLVAVLGRRELQLPSSIVPPLDCLHYNPNTVMSGCYKLLLSQFN